jgi:hypothetical protein
MSSDIKFVRDINRSTSYLASTRAQFPKGNAVEQIRDKADWDSVYELTKYIDKFLDDLERKEVLVVDKSSS